MPVFTTLYNIGVASAPNNAFLKISLQVLHKTF